MASGLDLSDVVRPDLEDSATREAIHRWLDGRLDEFQTILDARPHDALVVTPSALHWKHSLLIRYGRMVGAIEVLATLHKIAPATAVLLQRKLRGRTNVAINELIRGDQ